MPLTIDPSSTCDICLEKYSPQRQCYSIPCGHVFCGQCLGQIQGHSCPLCRANMLTGSSRIGRKLCVDFAPATSASSSSSSSAVSADQKKQIEDVLDTILESLNNKAITVQATNRMIQKVQNLLEDLPSNPDKQFRSIHIIKLLAIRLSIALTDLYEQTSLDRAQKASYETRIQELEKALRNMSLKRQSTASKGELSANRSHQHQHQHQPQASRSRAQAPSTAPLRFHKESSSRPSESTQRPTGSRKQTSSSRLTTIHSPVPPLRVPRPS